MFQIFNFKFPAKPTNSPSVAAVTRPVQAAAAKTKSSPPSPAKRSTTTPSGPPSDGDGYFNITGYPFPLGPLTKRRTIRSEVEKGRIWFFEQPQSLGFSNVTTNVRMTVIKLQSGGLWVHAPIAPTPQCLKLLKELDAPVEHIILPTFAYEHKIFVGPFSRRFPKAKVWIAPNQWSWPINLPPQFFGIFPTGGILQDNAPPPEWSAEIDQKVFISSVGIGPYIEVAFFHKGTKSLIVTDAVISVPNSPLELVQEKDLVSAAASNFFIKVLAGDEAGVPVTNDIPLNPTEPTAAVKALGWKRMALQILYIVPGDLRDPRDGFSAIAEKLIVGPILKTLVFGTTPDAARDWVEDICNDWDFRQIIPAHFSAPVKARPADLRAAFGFLYEDVEKKNMSSSSSSGGGGGGGSGLFGGLLSAFNSATPGSLSKKGFKYPEDDIKALNAARAFLVKAGVVNK
jgi:hypothetical protein